jgi:AcrR family transcriptional regulator
MDEEGRTKEERRKHRLARRRAQKRARILEAANQVLIEKGMESFSLDDVAERLALTTASLYHYFEGKDGLQVALAAELLAGDIEHFRSLVEDAEGGAEAVGALIRGCFSYYEQRLEQMVLILTVASSRLTTEEDRWRARKLLDPLFAALQERLAADVREGRLIRDIEPADVAMATLVQCGSVAIALHRFRYQGGSSVFELQELIDEISKTAVTSLRG